MWYSSSLSEVLAKNSLTTECLYYDEEKKRGKRNPIILIFRIFFPVALANAVATIYASVNFVWQSVRSVTQMTVVLEGPFIKDVRLIWWRGGLEKPDTHCYFQHNCLIRKQGNGV